jgi:hypothetical protein
LRRSGARKIPISGKEDLFFAQLSRIRLSG